jgi:hypothetical protein
MLEELPVYEEEAIVVLSQIKKRSCGARTILIAWFKEHAATAQGPYPTDAEKLMLSAQTGLSVRQVETFFANGRRSDRQMWRTEDRKRHLFLLRFVK